MSFVNLHVHSEYSMLDGMLRLDDLISFAAHHGQPAIAITDHGRMGGVAQFDKQAKAKGVKPLMGCELYIATNPLNKVKGEKRRHMTALAMNAEGLRNLLQLSNRGWLEGFYNRPRVGLPWMAEHSKGIVFLSGCMDGILSQLILEGRHNRALQLAGEMMERFDSFFIELMPRPAKEQVSVNQGLMAIASRLKIPMVITPDAHYLQEQQPYHKVLLGIQSGGRMWEFDSDCYHLMTREMMGDMASRNHPYISDRALESMLDNTLLVASLCDTSLESCGDMVPQPYPGLTAPEEGAKLRELCDRGWQLRKWEHKRNDPAYQKRLEHELEQIESLGFTRYFLVVYNLYDECIRPRKIFCGTGRGSAAGSLVCALLGITDPDPIETGLIFERFIAPGRVTSPDIDMDFESERRDEVKEWLMCKYGEDKTSGIGTHSRLRGKQVLQDVSRCLQVPIKDVEAVKQYMIERSLGDSRSSNTVEDTFLEFAEAQKFDKAHPEVLPACKALEGRIRNAGVHAAGVIVAPVPLGEMVPLESRSGKIVTAYEGGDIDKLGFLKLDVLGLHTLSAIREACQLADIEREDLVALDYEDPRVLEAFSAGRTAGVFQFNRDGITRFLRSMPINAFADLVALNSLYRPGGMHSGMSNKFIDRKNGKEEVKPLHPIYDDITKETLGLIVYQEQIMQVFGRMAGYNAQNIDFMRQKVAKRYGVEDFSQQKPIFIEGCAKTGVSPEIADTLFDQMAHFGSYAFNKAHAHVYTQLAYWCMWLKVYHPLAFYTAALNNEKDAEAYGKIFQTAVDEGMRVLLPHLNRSQEKATVEEGAIRLGLAGIKGISERGAAELMDKAPFRDLDDLYERINRRVINVRIREVIAELGMLDDDTYREWDADYARWSKFCALPVSRSLHGNLESLTAGAPYHWSNLKDLDGKGGVVYIRGLMQRVVLQKIGDFATHKVSKWPKGMRYATISISDGTQTAQMRVSPDTYGEYQDVLKPGNLFFARCYKVKDLDSMLFVQRMRLLEGDEFAGQDTSQE